MLIGELSKKTGLSRDTIRFYEKKGLIVSSKSKSLYNNYKEYTEETQRRLQLVMRVKNFGFTLSEVAGFLDMIGARRATCGNVSEMITHKVSLIDQKISELQTLKSMMMDEINSCPCDMPQALNEECPIFN